MYTEISEGLDLLWRNDVDPGKVLLGLGFYGRSFTLNDTSCTTPGCQFDRVFDNGGGTPGKCTDTSGILSNYEINDILTTYDPKVVYNEAAAVNWITWLDNQWYVNIVHSGERASSMGGRMKKGVKLL